MHIYVQNYEVERDGRRDDENGPQTGRLGHRYVYFLFSPFFLY
jgi:hypothetical protein